MTSTVRTQLVIAAIITVPAVVVGFLAGLSLGLPGIPPEIPPVDAVPVAEVPGKDVPGLPRYPGAARVKYEYHPLGDARVWEVGYFVEDRVSEVGSFYKKRLHEHGWTFEGSHFYAGELALRARRDDIEMLIEIGQQGEMVEIEMEVYEPRPS
jgi:hypothetical protein